MENEQPGNGNTFMMILDSMFVHPKTLKRIPIDRKKEEVFLESDDRYKAGLIDGVPFLLPRNSSALKSSKLHEDMGSSFDYQDHYQKDAEVFNYFQEFSSRVDQEERNRLDQMILSKIPEDAASILDVGCGSGWLAKAKAHGDTTVISMDISSRNPVEALRQHPHPNHEALIADVYHLPLEESSIDCIVASEIMEHVPDPAMFVEKLLFVLKPGGKLIITTPYDEQIQYHLCVHCNHPTPAHAHLHSFNENNIIKLIPSNVQSWNWTAFSHEYLSKSRFYVLIKGLSFGGWKWIDSKANKVWRRPMRLMMEVLK
ncbi:class I SAM-dependent methyltransferase [Membranicola marinus]|uniref:Class I SAM-dependent methyltransferase n=1 Tax=Membranihabitans marinus TaxID=1227546 RepID=A0A953I1C7_9BACT|nr:class I SAM-dependent methyltransferase [Membranihabitans marinus]MBY5959492.1 class I SAM-dependent methyltransferase [Membranihabitans marinus]